MPIHYSPCHYTQMATAQPLSCKRIFLKVRLGQWTFTPLICAHIGMIVKREDREDEMFGVQLQLFLCTHFVCIIAYVLHLCAVSF